MPQMKKVKRIPKEVLDYYNRNFAASEGYTMDFVYSYWGYEYNKETRDWDKVKYYGIAIRKQGSIWSYPQDTLKGFASPRYDGMFKFHPPTFEKGITIN